MSSSFADKDYNCFLSKKVSFFLNIFSETGAFRIKQKVTQKFMSSCVRLLRLFLNVLNVGQFQNETLSFIAVLFSQTTVHIWEANGCESLSLIKSTFILPTYSRQIKITWNIYPQNDALVNLLLIPKFSWGPIIDKEFAGVRMTLALRNCLFFCDPILIWLFFYIPHVNWKCFHFSRRYKLSHNPWRKRCLLPIWILKDPEFP